MVGEELNASQQTLIAGADTLFVASAHPEFGVDALHRGGHQGFVHIINNQQLRIPGFAGNSMFNTLGNFTSYPYAGLIFIDFQGGISGGGRLLQLTGKAKILWDMDDPQKETGGTRRYWQFDITSWQASTLSYRFAWELLDESPHIPELQRYLNVNDTLLLQVERIQQETDRVKSFCLRAVDGQRLDLKELLATPKPGTHVYVCGPRGMINVVREIAAEQGWPSTHIHFESFGAQPLANDKAICVYLDKSNQHRTS